jgi:hypothetical protein
MFSSARRSAVAWLLAFFGFSGSLRSVSRRNTSGWQKTSNLEDNIPDKATHSSEWGKEDNNAHGTQ